MFTTFFLTSQAFSSTPGVSSGALIQLSIAISNPVIQPYTPIQTNFANYILDVSGLTAATTYSFYAAVDNQFSVPVVSPYTPPASSPTVNLSAALANIVTMAASGVAPDTVISPILTSYSDTGVSFLWGEPVKCGSASSAISYKVTRQNAGSGAFTPITGSPFSVLSAQDTGLTQATVYNYNIVSSNGVDQTTPAPST
jgi:hypothetical protein